MERGAERFEEQQTRQVSDIPGANRNLPDFVELLRPGKGQDERQHFSAAERDNYQFDGRLLPELYLDGLNQKADRGAAGNKLTAESLACGQEKTASTWNTTRLGSEAITARLVKEGFRASGKESSGDELGKYADDSQKRRLFKEFGKDSADFIDTFQNDPRFEMVQKGSLKESELKRGDIIVWPRDSKHPYGLSKIYLGDGRNASDHISSLKSDLQEMGTTRPFVFRLKQGPETNTSQDTRQESSGRKGEGLDLEPPAVKRKDPDSKRDTSASWAAERTESIDPAIEAIDKKYPFNVDSLKPQCQYDRDFLQAKENFKQRQLSGEVPTVEQLFEKARAAAPEGQRFFEASVPYWVSADGSQHMGENYMWDANGKLVSQNYWRRAGDQLGHGKDVTIYHNIETRGGAGAPNKADSRAFGPGTDEGWINQSTNKSLIARGGNPPVDMHGRSMSQGTSAGCEAHPSDKNYQNWPNFRDKMHHAIKDNYARGLDPFASLHIGTQWAMRAGALRQNRK